MECLVTEFGYMVIGGKPGGKLKYSDKIQKVEQGGTGKTAPKRTLSSEGLFSHLGPLDLKDAPMPRVISLLDYFVNNHNDIDEINKFWDTLLNWVKRENKLVNPGMNLENVRFHGGKFTVEDPKAYFNTIYPSRPTYEIFFYLGIFMVFCLSRKNEKGVWKPWLENLIKISNREYPVMSIFKQDFTLKEAKERFFNNIKWILRSVIAKEDYLLKLMQGAITSKSPKPSLQIKTLKNNVGKKYIEIFRDFFEEN